MCGEVVLVEAVVGVHSSAEQVTQTSPAKAEPSFQAVVLPSDTVTLANLLLAE